MTFYESNRDVLPTGGEVDEFVTQPESVPEEPPSPRPTDTSSDPDDPPDAEEE